MKLIALFFVILLGFSNEDISQTDLILTKELVDETEKEYREINKKEENSKSKFPTLFNFRELNTCSSPYISAPHSLGQGCNKLGQCTQTFCAVHSLKQVLFKFGITKYNEYTLAKYAGTTGSGTSHEGIEKALKMVSKKEGIKLRIEWHTFSSLGSSISERFKAIGKKICNKNVDVIIHNLYRNKWGHYETIQTIDMSKNSVLVLNSLGTRSGAGYLGHKEWRSFKEYANYISGISQRSIAFIYKN